MPGHPRLLCSRKERRDARDKPGHDGLVFGQAPLPTRAPIAPRIMPAVLELWGGRAWRAAYSFDRFRAPWRGLTPRLAELVA